MPGLNSGWNGFGDPRRQSQTFGNRDGRRQFHSGGPSVVYFVSPGYGYGYGYDQGGYYPHYYGGVTDANGRPLYMTPEPQGEYMPLESQGGQASYAYTPDLSGSPYSVTDEGMMVVDFADAPRRAFPSCAVAADTRDPQGRPRTIFYQSTDYWMVLRPGQRGRVQGAPPANTKACYAVDSVGRVVLRY